MRKSLTISAIFFTLAACATTPALPVNATADGTGAVAPRMAVDAFLDAVRAEDLQAMGATWGTSAGSARNTIDLTELEKSVIIMQCYLQHDSYRVLGETPG